MPKVHSRKMLFPSDLSKPGVHYFRCKCVELLNTCYIFNCGILLCEAPRAQKIKQKLALSLRNQNIQSATMTMQMTRPPYRTKTTSRLWLRPDDSLSVGKDRWCIWCAQRSSIITVSFRRKLITPWLHSIGSPAEVFKCDFNSRVHLLDLKGRLTHLEPVTWELRHRIFVVAGGIVLYLTGSYKHLCNHDIHHVFL